MAAKRPVKTPREKTDGKARRLKNLRPPWKPGESGNPGGRPRKEIVTARLERFAEQLVPEDMRKLMKLKAGARWADAWVVVMNRAVITGARQSQIAAFREMLDRIEGKSVARVEVAGEGGGPIEIDEIRSRLWEKLLR